MPTLDHTHLVEWAPIIEGQKDRLTRIAGGIHAVITAAGKLGIKDEHSPQADALREILELFAVAAGTSHLAQTSEGKLREALQRQNVLTLRALQATERNMMSGVDQLEQQRSSHHDVRAIGQQSTGIEQRSLRLQERLANGEKIDQDELEDVSLNSEELALDSRVTATLMGIRELNKAAVAASKGDAATIARLFSGEFRSLPALTKHISDELTPIRNDFIIDRNELRRDAHLGTPSAARKRSLRAQRRKSLATAQQRFQKLATNHDLNHFFKHASELIENQQFRTAIVQVAAMIGISLVGGAIAGLAARGVGGVMLEATGAETVSELGMTARAGIAATRIGVDTTISSAGTVAVQGGSFSEVWKENLIRVSRARRCSVRSAATRPSRPSSRAGSRRPGEARASWASSASSARRLAH